MVAAKIDVNDKMKRPGNMRDIQCFLWMLVYYRRFIPDFAKTAELLTHLLRGKVPFVLGEA